MARGWESKSVESQIEDAGSGSNRSSQEDPLTPEQRAVWNRLRGLELSRKRVLQDLETARSPVRRTALEQALADAVEAPSRPAVEPRRGGGAATPPPAPARC